VTAVAGPEVDGGRRVPGGQVENLADVHVPQPPAHHRAHRASWLPMIVSRTSLSYKADAGSRIPEDPAPLEEVVEWPDRRSRSCAASW
jgi:hypothetical protein